MSVTGPDPILWSTQEEGWLSDFYFLRVFSNGLLIIELSLMTISSLPERLGGREKIVHQFLCLGQHLQQPHLLCGPTSWLQDAPSSNATSSLAPLALGWWQLPRG